MGLIEREKLITDIQGIVSEVCMKSPYDPEWFTRLHNRQNEIIHIIEIQSEVDAVEVIHCKDCACVRAVFLGNKFVYRYPMSTVDVEPDGYCSRGVKRNEDLGRS